MTNPSAPSPGTLARRARWERLSCVGGLSMAEAQLRRLANSHEFDPDTRRAANEIFAKIANLRIHINSLHYMQRKEP